MDVCRYWRKYEKGIDYLTIKGLVNKTNKAWNFYSGKQWEGIKAGGEELPFLNFIKPVIKHKVSTVSQNNMVAHFSDSEGRNDLGEVYALLDQKFSASWEEANMDMVLWSVIKDSAVTGDGILYFGTKEMADVQQLPNTSVLYGDESESDIQKQPYIIVHQRMLVKTVREKALANGIDPTLVAAITPDQDTEYMVGNKDEVDEDSSSEAAKVTVLFYFTKINGIVHVAKCTKNVIFEEEHPIAVTNPDGTMGKGLELYPFVKISWEDYPNDARGVSEVSQLIPNQLEVNKTLARRSMIIQLTAYPRLAYDSQAIANPDELTKVGAPIEIEQAGSTSVNQLITYLDPANSSQEPKAFMQDLIDYSQELSGSGETAMGNINPTRVAASAIIAIRDQAALPLNEQVAKMKTFVEDFARLSVEIWHVYNPEGMEVIYNAKDPETGMDVPQVMTITKENWDELKPHVRIDTSQDNPWTKEAEQNWLDGALDKGYIDFMTYLKAVPENGIVPKNKMITLIQEMQAEQAAMQEQLPEQAITPEG